MDKEVRHKSLKKVQHELFKNMAQHQLVHIIYVLSSNVLRWVLSSCLCCSASSCSTSNTEDALWSVCLWCVCRLDVDVKLSSDWREVCWKRWEAGWRPCALPQGSTPRQTVICSTHPLRPALWFDCDGREDKLLGWRSSDEEVKKKNILRKNNICRCRLLSRMSFRVQMQRQAFNN